MGPENSVAVVTVDTRDAAQRSSGRSRFYVAMGAVAVGIVLIGFGPGVTFSPTKRYGPPTTFIWFHSLVFAMWLSLYLVQTVLIRGRNIRMHRRLGWVGAPLAVAIVAVGYVTTIAQGRRGFALWWDPDAKADVLGELVHPLGDLLSFSVLVIAALVFRRRSAVHKRLMLLATVGSMMAAPLVHFLSYFPPLRGVPPVILLPLGALYFSSAVYDRLAHGRIHPVSLWGGLALFLWAMFRGAVLGPSAAWHRFAGWLIG